jgi:hypothetical protein
MRAILRKQFDGPDVLEIRKTSEPERTGGRNVQTAK